MKVPMSNFTEISPVVAEPIRAARHTDMKPVAFLFATMQITTDSALTVSNDFVSFEFHNAQLSFLHTAVHSSSL